MRGNRVIELADAGEVFEAYLQQYEHCVLAFNAM